MEGNIKDIAAEMNVSTQYLYAILAGTETDSFAVFEYFFRSACNAPKASVDPWLNKLNSIAAAKNKIPIAEHSESATEELLRKIKTDAATTEQFCAAISDGVLTERECHELLAGVARYRQTADRLESLLHARLGELADNPAPLRVATRRNR